jgi:hypothetical protein
MLSPPGQDYLSIDPLAGAIGPASIRSVERTDGAILPWNRE